jgi:hypothetical protein
LCQRALECVTAQALAQRFQRQDVGGGDIPQVDVVAEAQDQVLSKGRVGSIKRVIPIFSPCEAEASELLSLCSDEPLLFAGLCFFTLGAVSLFFRPLSALFV